MRWSSSTEARFAVGGGLRLAVAVTAISVLLSACTADETPSRDLSATARLDQTTGQILTPLSEYDLTDSQVDIALLNQAIRIWIAACMSDAGYRYSATMAEVGIPDDRDYGIWFEPNARIYGWGFPPSSVDTALQEDATAGGQEWTDAERECGDRVREDPVLGAILPSPQEETNSIVPNLRTEAYRLASSDPEWEQAREEWWDCLRAEGLEPLTGAQDWFSAQSKASLEASGVEQTSEQIEEQIVLASIEARCNNDTGLTQLLGDLVASYQAPLIEKNQAALNEFKDLKQERLNRARDFVAQNG